MSDVELGQSQYKISHEFVQSNVELGQSQSDIKLILELEPGQLDVGQSSQLDVGQSQLDVELILEF